MIHKLKIMSNNQGILFGSKVQMASCPFNPSHKFEKQKLVFHITRCKDKQKRMPYMAKCKYNSFHYVDKQKLLLHQQYCADRTADQKSILKYQQNFRNSQRENYHQNYSQQRRDRESSGLGQIRSRSREMKREQPEFVQEKEVKIKIAEQHEHEQDIGTLSECQECQNTMKRFKDKIMQNGKISKLIRKYEQLAGYSIL